MRESDETINALDKEAQKRREAVNIKAAKPLPEIIRSIQSTTVVYTVHPSILPFSLVDPQRLVLLIHQRFGLNFRHPEYTSSLKNLGIDPSNITEEGILQFLFRGSKPQISFENGRYSTGPDFILIEDLAFGRETIAATVKGITDVAELVISESFSIFWEAAGAPKRWDNRETQKNIQLVSYRSVTDVELGFPSEMLLNIKLKEFLDSEIPKKCGIGVSMLPYSSYDKFSPNPNAVATWSFDRQIINVHVFDPINGINNTAQIDIDVTARGNRGRGVIELTTELPLDLHVKLAEQICQAVIKPT